MRQVELYAISTQTYIALMSVAAFLAMVGWVSLLNPRVSHSVATRYATSTAIEIRPQQDLKPALASISQ